jgi:hypothetical protein
MSSDENNSSQSAWLMIQAGLGVLAMAAMAVGLWWFRTDWVPAYQQQSERLQLIALGEQARGNQPLSVYREGEWIRVDDFAPARRPDGRWVGLETNTVLVVRSMADGGNGAEWVEACRLEQSGAPPLRIHGSFVERYEPTLLADGLELSDCRIHRMLKSGRVYYSVSGQLRNATAEPIPRCEVVCHLHNGAGEPLAELRSAPMELAALGFGGFETTQGAGGPGVAALSLAVQYEKAGVTNDSPQVLVRLRPMPEVPHERAAN